MAKIDIFGWDLLFKVTQPQIRNNEDVLICLVHWRLIHQGFKCVGIGEDTTQPKQEEMSETLPEGWNAAQKYILRYVYNGKVYILNATHTEGNIIINMNRICDNHATGTCINVNVVQNRSGALDRIIPTYEQVITKITSELVEPMFAKVPSKDTHTQTPSQSTSQESNPLRCEPRRSNMHVPYRQPSLPSFVDPWGVGRSDLEPLGGFGGGGMLLPQPGNPGAPIGPPNLPPGARFDPLGPLGPLGPVGPLPGPMGPPRRPPDNRRPDYDHLPPPGYDDMFM